MKHALLTLWIALLAVSQAMEAADSAPPKRPNVLFLISDDLNCRIGCYGDPIAKTPNLDRLARSGVRFERAYCQFPLCNATRSSVLSGRYPTTTGVLDNFTWLVLPNGRESLMPTYFERHGYAIGLTGKVFHLKNTGYKPDDAALSNTKDQWFTPTERVQQRIENPNPPDGFFLDARSMTCIAPERYAEANRYGLLPEGDHGTDAPIADEAISLLNRLSSTGKPFFLGVGFRKPHVPLLAPKEFLDLYEALRMPLPPDFANKPQGGSNLPPDEFRANRDLFAGRTFTATEAREAIRAYYACISYMDAQLGRVLDELERLGLQENTIIVMWGDHGWHLSEKGLWAKDTLFEASARGPLMIVDPRRRQSAGRSSPRVVQYLDMYPTLVDLCGLPALKTLEGASLTPLLDDPKREWNHPAYTVQTRGWFLGRSIRTERWRYTEWDEGRRGTALFDHDADPYEMRNLADDPRHATTVAELKKPLHASPISKP